VGDRLAVGSQLIGVEKRISFETMRKYSGETGIHAQDDAGKESGLGGALVQGGQLVAYLNQMMTDNFGEGYLRGGEISVSFIKPVRPRDVITAMGIVREIRSEGARIQTMCEVWLENQNSQKTTVGTASAFLISPRESGECG
jgi:acyl dehydratase